MSKVCEDLSEHFEQSISSNLTDETVLTGTFNNEELESILKAIEISLDVVAKHEDQNIVICKFQNP